MKNYYKIFLLLSFLFLSSYSVYALEPGIEKISPVISNTLKNLNIKTIAVIDFTNLKGNPTNFGRFIAEEFTTALVNSPDNFNVIDRTYMKAFLKKNGIRVSNFINPSSIMAIAKISGVILTGTFVPLKNTVKIFTKIISTNTGKILATFNFNMNKDSNIDSLLSTGQNIKTVLSSNNISRPAALQIQESHGLFFDLTKCKLTSLGITCNLIITNNSNPDNIFILLSARAVDEYGNIYPVLKATMNGTTVSSDGAGNFGSLANNSNLFSVNASQNTSIPLTLVFNNTTGNIQKISLLEITFSSKQQQITGNLILTMQENPYTVKFSNLSLTQKEE